MIWVPLGVLIGGVVLAIVVFAFGAYEINWKVKRLRGDLERLNVLNERLGGLEAELSGAAERVNAAQRTITEARQ